VGGALSWPIAETIFLDEDWRKEIPLELQAEALCASLQGTRIRGVWAARALCRTDARFNRGKTNRAILKSMVRRAEISIRFVITDSMYFPSEFPALRRGGEMTIPLPGPPLSFQQFNSVSGTIV